MVFEKFVTGMSGQEVGVINRGLTVKLAFTWAIVLNSLHFNDLVTDVHREYIWRY